MVDRNQALGGASFVAAPELSGCANESVSIEAPLRLDQFLPSVGAEGLGDLTRILATPVGRPLVGPGAQPQFSWLGTVDTTADSPDANRSLARLSRATPWRSTRPATHRSEPDPPGSMGRYRVSRPGAAGREAERCSTPAANISALMAKRSGATPDTALRGGPGTELRPTTLRRGWAHSCATERHHLTNTRMRAKLFSKSGFQLPKQEPRRRFLVLERRYREGRRRESLPGRRWITSDADIGFPN